MNKNVLIVISIIVALIVASVGYLLLTPHDAAMPRENSTTSATTQKKPSSRATDDSTSPARYVAYTADSFSSDTGPKVLFFYADWCPKCRALDADLSADINSLDNVTIYKVDYDTATDLRKQYGVTQQTTLVKTDEQGVETASFVAYDEPTLDAVREHLAL